jgi:4-alpha-glucanotransferase
MQTATSWGVGDFCDLRQFCSWARRSGARYVFLGPTSAGHVIPPVHPSPYSPSSRLFHQLIHLYPPAIPGWESLGPSTRRAAVTALELTDTQTVDLDAVLALKLPVLRELFRRANDRPSMNDEKGLAAFRADMGAELRLFALYCASETQHGQDWRHWPAELRTPSRALSSPWARRNEEMINFFEWCQWQLDQQFSAASAHGVGLVRDLPVGTPLKSADAWMWQDCLAADEMLGAPPDYFSPVGHGWDLVPYHPRALAAVGFHPFRRTLHAAFRHAAGVRIDHALGLLRQYWIPSGRSPSEGRYVDQNGKALMDIIAIEAHRRQAFVVSEELGTIPPGGTKVFRERDFLDFAAVIAEGFDLRSLGGVVAASTHDLPTIAGCWTGEDCRMLAAAGIPVDHGFSVRARERLRRHSTVSEYAPADQVALRLYGSLAASDAVVVVLSVEDALGMVTRPNVPGSSPSKWPNFRRRLPALTELDQSLILHRLTAALRTSR